MSAKHTEEQKIRVLALLAAGTSVNEIVKATGVPRSTIYFWKKAATDPKPEQPAQDRKPSVESRLAKLEGLVVQLDAWRNEVDPQPSVEDKITVLLEEILPWVRRKMREETKERERREYEAGDSRPKFILGRKTT